MTHPDRERLERDLDRIDAILDGRDDPDREPERRQWRGAKVERSEEPSR